MPKKKTYVVMCPEHAKERETRKPPPEEIALIKPGNWCKIWDNAEGFFVKITEYDGKIIKGTVDQDLVKEHDFTDGDTLEFTVENVTEVYTRGTS